MAKQYVKEGKQPINWTRLSNKGIPRHERHPAVYTNPSARI